MSIPAGSWWEIATKLGSVKTLAIAVDPREARLTPDPELHGFDRVGWDRKIRAALAKLQPQFDAMLACSRGPAPTFLVSPEEFDTFTLNAVIQAHECARALRADASVQHEAEHHRACVERIEAIAGLARHVLGRSETLWVLKGMAFLGIASQAVRVFAASFRHATAERVQLRRAFVRLEELNPAPWPAILQAEIESRRAVPDHEWPTDLAAGTARQDVRDAIDVIGP